MGTDDRNAWQLNLADELRLVVKKYRSQYNLSAVEAWEATSDVADELAAGGPDVMRATTSSDD